MARLSRSLVKQAENRMSAEVPSVLVNSAEFSRRLQSALETATAELLAQRNARGYWEGELSSSALSTATAVTALALAARNGASFATATRLPASAIASGLQWLVTHQNPD